MLLKNDEYLRSFKDIQPIPHIKIKKKTNVTEPSSDYNYINTILV